MITCDICHAPIKRSEYDVHRAACAVIETAQLDIAVGAVPYTDQHTARAALTKTRQRQGQARCHACNGLALLYPTCSACGGTGWIDPEDSWG